jgi:hypothetical protein
MSASWESAELASRSSSCTLFDDAPVGHQRCRVTDSAHHFRLVGDQHHGDPGAPVDLRLSRSRICSVVAGSSALVASSQNSTSGRAASARAMPTRCFCPPDKLGRVALPRPVGSARPVRAVRRPGPRVRPWATPCTSSGNATLLGGGARDVEQVEVLEDHAHRVPDGVVAGQPIQRCQLGVTDRHRTLTSVARGRSGNASASSCLHPLRPRMPKMPAGRHVRRLTSCTAVDGLVPRRTDRPSSGW